MNPVLLRSLDDVGRIAQRLRDAWESQGGKPLEISLKRYKPRRSADQNSLLWVTHGLVAERLNELQAQALENPYLSPEMIAALRHPWDKDAAHELIFKPRYCGGCSSTRLNKQEMADALTDYQAWAVGIGIKFPEREPNQDEWR